MDARQLGTSVTSEQILARIEEQTQAYLDSNWTFFSGEEAKKIATEYKNFLVEGYKKAPLSAPELIEKIILDIAGNDSRLKGSRYCYYVLRAIYIALSGCCKASAKTRWPEKAITADIEEMQEKYQNPIDVQNLFPKKIKYLMIYRGLIKVHGSLVQVLLEQTYRYIQSSSLLSKEEGKKRALKYFFNTILPRTERFDIFKKYFLEWFLEWIDVFLNDQGAIISDLSESLSESLSIASQRWSKNYKESAKEIVEDDSFLKIISLLINRKNDFTKEKPKIDCNEMEEFLTKKLTYSFVRSLFKDIQNFSYNSLLSNGHTYREYLIRGIIMWLSGIDKEMYKQEKFPEKVQEIVNDLSKMDASVSSNRITMPQIVIDLLNSLDMSKKVVSPLFSASMFCEILRCLSVSFENVDDIQAVVKILQTGVTSQDNNLISDQDKASVNLLDYEALIMSFYMHLKKNALELDIGSVDSTFIMHVASLLSNAKDTEVMGLFFSKKHLSLPAFEVSSTFSFNAPEESLKSMFSSFRG